MSSEKFISEELESQMRTEFDKLPSFRKAAHVDNMKKSNFPESTAFYEKIKDDPAMEAKIQDEAENGNPAAMLLISRRFYNLGFSYEGFRWLTKAYESGSGEAAFLLGFGELDRDKKEAFRYLTSAFRRGHEGGTLTLATLCNQSSASELGVEPATREETLTLATREADRITFYSALVSLLPGTHPVQFMESSGIPWGTGTLIIVDWKGQQFALTASHVIKASNARPDQINLLIPDYEVPIPIVKESCVDFKNRANEDLDVFGWLLDKDSANDVAWAAWDLNHFWRPATALRVGQTLFVLGYPNTEDKINLEKMVMERHPLIVKGKLASHGNAGQFTIDCAEFSVDIDGVSGSPVFAMIGGMYFFVGLAQWGGTEAKKIHFLDAAEITEALDYYLAQIK